MPEKAGQQGSLTHQIIPGKPTVMQPGILLNLFLSPPGCTCRISRLAENLPEKIALTGNIPVKIP